MPGLFQELKRRNVFKVGAAYVVMAWLVAQGVDVFLENFGAPDWVIKTLLLLLIVGFPFAVFFAWAFELTPEGLKREKEVDRTLSITRETGRKLDFAIIGLLLLGLGYFAVDKFVLAPGQNAGQETAAQVKAPAESVTVAEPGLAGDAAEVRSIAVLPFANRSNAQDDLYFTDGIHDDLLTQLAKVHDLTVISRTSVMEYRGSSKNLRQIGTELNVGTILEGGVQKVGNRVRINAQLIDVATDRHLWAETFDRELTAENVFDLQTEIARKIVQAVAVQLSPEEERLLAEIPTRSMAAYDAYLRARSQYYGANYTRSQEVAAQPLIQRALELDPDYVDALVLLASIYSQVYWRGIDTSDTLLRTYRETLDRAIALNPDSPAALRAQANFHYRVQNDYRRSLDLLDKAIRKAPGSVDLHGDRALSLRRLGRWEESIASFERAMQLDPANRFYNTLLLETLGGVRRWSDIVDRSVPLEDADPDELDNQVIRAVAQFNLSGDLQPLKRVFERMNLVASSQYRSYSAYVHWLGHDADATIAVLNGPLWQVEGEDASAATARGIQLADAWRLKGDADQASALYRDVAGLKDAVMGSALQTRAFGGSDVALAMARLGDFGAALDLANLLVSEVPLERDAMLTGSLLLRRALVRGLAGDEDGAIVDLEQALRLPGSFPVTAWDLHYDPNWDFMRDNTRFAELATPANLLQTGGS